MSNLFKVSMFFTSFIPLWITIIFKDVLSICSGEKYLFTEWMTIIVLMIFSVLSIIIVQKAIKDVKNNSGSSDYEILSAEQINGITSEFLLAYVLPLFAFDFTTWIGVVEFLVYFLVLLFLCVRNNNVYANLFLEFKGYRFFDCEMQLVVEPNTKPMKMTILSKKPLESKIGHVITVKVLNKPFYLGE